MEDIDVFVREAVAVGMKAQEQGLTRLRLERDELEQRARAAIEAARRQLDVMMETGLIPSADEPAA